MLKFNLDSTKLLRGFLYGGLVFLFLLLQITLLPQYPILGVTPDAILSCVLAAAMFEGRRFGAVTGICAGFLIDAIGSTGLSLSPLFYMLAGFLTGICAQFLFRRGLLSWTLTAAAAYFLRSFVTLIHISVAWTHYSLADAVSGVIAPEFFTSLLLSYPVYFIFRLAAKRFHRSDELRN